MNKYHKLADLLLELEMTMRQMNIWEMHKPSEQDLASQEPFCIDTMKFDQWLRFVMIERYKSIIEQQDSLPNYSNITPLASMYFKERSDNGIAQFLTVLKNFDQFINQASS